MRSEASGPAGSAKGAAAVPPAPAPVLVLCVGSTLMGDDGVGLAVLERLRDGWILDGAELVDGGTWGMNVLPAIESAERLLLVDAIRAGKQPGAVVRLEGDEIPRFFATKLSPHQIDLKEVLALAELRGTLPEVVALGVEPGRVELSTELSPEVEGALPELVRRAVGVLRGWGVAVGEAAPSGGTAPCTR
ncbi:MAG TPA: HyaD/HybD family hydrogenase maturation endopeptidase [Longimicrobiales bacterium]|nr:HyaD/HybD family hydrogenase maturation endopeptidase [Longimicrobiales bacterium]